LWGPMKHILLVEDNESVREVIRTCLEAGGYYCSEVADGEAAREWLQTEKPIDLILTDHDMPRLKGLELLQWVHTHPEFTHLPVILYSGEMTGELRERALQAGAIAVLEKPFLFQRLLDLIAQVLPGA
jgi:CheY-like chemotaxis protein